MIIRAIAKSDAVAFHQLVKKNLDYIRDYFPKTAVAAQSPARARDMVETYLRKSKKNELHVFVAEDGALQRLTGAFYAKEIDAVHSKCEIAYFTDEDMQGQGIASTGVSALLHFIFGVLKLNKISCRVSTDNPASMRVAEKHGFVLEGVLKKEFRISSGKFIDINCYGLLNDERGK
jgi:ribosomal-protein-serine acetyltransferase